MADLERQKNHCEEYRYRMVAMLKELENFIQPTANDKVMLVEMDQRDRTRQLVGEAIRHFEHTSEGGGLDFETLRKRVEKI